MAFNRRWCFYTPEGRALVHENLSPSFNLLYQLRSSRPMGETIEYYDNRLSLYTMQQGKCYVLGKPFLTIKEIHCHHKIAKENNGTDEFKNLVLVNVDVHKLIHATKEETILHYLGILGLNVMQMRKVNYLRFELNLPVIKEYNPEEHKLTLKRIESYLDI